MKGYLLPVLISCLTSAGPHTVNDHDIHLSLCELRYNESSSSFEVAIKIFIDDLELAIRKQGVPDFTIGDGKSEWSDRHIAEYLNRKFQIEIDGSLLKGHYLGKEVTDDLLAVWCYVEFETNSRPSRKCVLSNNILFEIYQDQRNIMDIRMSNTHKDYTILEPGKHLWTYMYR